MKQRDGPRFETHTGIMLIAVALAVVVCLNSTTTNTEHCYFDHRHRRRCHRRVVVFVFVIVVIIIICSGGVELHRTGSPCNNFINIKKLRLVENEFTFHPWITRFVRPVQYTYHSLERAQVKNETWQRPIQTDIRGLLLTIHSLHLIEKLHNTVYILDDYQEPRLLTAFINGCQLKIL